MQEKDPVDKLDRNKVYFLVIVIVALVGINGYLYFKDQQQNSRFVSVSTDKDRLKLEVEKIEVELDKVNSLNLNLSEKLQNEQEVARKKIQELKISLQKGKLTQYDLTNAQVEIKKLRDFVKTYNDQVSRLEKENSYLKIERDSLKITAETYNQKAEDLEKENEDLNAKVKVGAALKTSNITITAYKVKSSGKNTLVTKASNTNKLLINFSIAVNNLAKQTEHTVYVRVFDPAGNLIISKEEDLFEADGQKMQFSAKTQVNFANDGNIFNIDWVNPKEFRKGTYSLILYADGFIMGKSEIALK